MTISKPTPLPDAASAGFWEAAGRHQLAIQRCGHCGHLAHPPALICPRCLSTDPRFGFETVSGRGVLRTWTIMRDAFLPGFRDDIPWAIGEAELDGTGGVRLLARLADGPDGPYRPGAPVETIFEDIEPGLSLPVLRLVHP
jgi:uncharacterized protein